MSLEKKLKELRLLKDVKLETDYVQLGKALEELGVVAQRIREIDCSDWKSLNACLELDFTPDYLTAWKVAESFQKKLLGLLVEDSEETKKNE